MMHPSHSSKPISDRNSQPLSLTETITNSIFIQRVCESVLFTFANQKRNTLVQDIKDSQEKDVPHDRTATILGQQSPFEFITTEIVSQRVSECILQTTAKRKKKALCCEIRRSELQQVSRGAASGPARADRRYAGETSTRSIFHQRIQEYIMYIMARRNREKLQNQIKQSLTSHTKSTQCTKSSSKGSSSASPVAATMNPATHGIFHQRVLEILMLAVAKRRKEKSCIEIKDSLVVLTKATSRHKHNQIRRFHCHQSSSKKLKLYYRHKERYILTEHENRRDKLYRQIKQSLATDQMHHGHKNSKNETVVQSGQYPVTTNIVTPRIAEFILLAMSRWRRRKLCNHIKTAAVGSPAAKESSTDNTNKTSKMKQKQQTVIATKFTYHVKNGQIKLRSTSKSRSKVCNSNV